MKEYIDFQDIVDLFKKIFEYNADISDEDGEAHSFKNNDLLIGVFDYEYPNYNLAGSIRGEYIDTFNKWTNVYYRCNIPATKEGLDVIIEDLKYLASEKNEANKIANKNLSELVRYI